MTNEAVTQSDIVIVGAGPVGLLLALLCAKQQLSVRIFERQPVRYPLGRAAAIDHESVRLLGAAGLQSKLDELLQDVIHESPGKTFAWRDAEGEMIVDLHWEEPSLSGPPKVSGFRQCIMEDMLEEVALGAGVSLHRGYELKDYVDRGHGVEARFVPYNKGEASSQPAITAHSRFMVGADGANSGVRSRADITFHDLGFQYDWLVCDIVPQDGHVPEMVQKYGAAQFCDPKRPTTLVFGGPGRKRLEFMRMPDESREWFSSEATAWELITAWGYTPNDSALERYALYTFRARWAEEWKRGNVFLAGDAAHQMPPFIGQGLNSGFRDANALAWRLALVVKGKSSPEVLESYTTERLAHIQALTKHCILLGKIICELDPTKARKTHESIRANPPPDGFDPPLGRPGVFTDQDSAAKLSLHRRLKTTSGGVEWADKLLGGLRWTLLTNDAALRHRLSSETAKRFEHALNGALVVVAPEQDISGEYGAWLRELDADAVLVRPDFYVYGAARSHTVEALLEDAFLRLHLQ